MDLSFPVREFEFDCDADDGDPDVKCWLLLFFLSATFYLWDVIIWSLDYITFLVAQILSVSCAARVC